MASKAVKKEKDGLAQASSKRQSKLNFNRTVKKPSSAPGLTQLLSQYQLLQIITSHLSSADIVHLAATNKEHRSYMMDNQLVFTRMKFFALCDGKGLEARAKCFGHFDSDVKNATVKCQEEFGFPCHKCEAMVCNTCRFHVMYVDLLCCQQDSVHYEEHERDYVKALENIRTVHQDRCAECPAFHSGNLPIESIRAVNLAGEPRERHYCATCKPPIFEDKSVFEVLMDAEEEGRWCSCDLSTEFITESWLCIPCFFDMEAKACARRISRDVYRYRKEKQDGQTVIVREHLDNEEMCDCGEVANILNYTECRWCELPIRSDDFDSAIYGFA